MSSREQNVLFNEWRRLFDDWWTREGRFVDPDTSDVPWFDKRKELCALAWNAAMAQSGNCTVNDAVTPTRVRFENGRLVYIGSGGFLGIDREVQ